jgi:prevent-host-death family protein
MSTALKRKARKPRAPAALPALVNVHEAKTQLSRLLARVAAGEEIVIARAGQPFARLVPLVAAADPNPYLALSIAAALAKWDRDHPPSTSVEPDVPATALARSGSRPNPLAEL